MGDVQAVRGNVAYVEFDGVEIDADMRDFDPGTEAVLEENTAIPDTLVNYTPVRERVRPRMSVLIHDDAQGQAIQAALEQGNSGNLIWGYFGHATGDPKWGIVATVVVANIPMKHDDLQVLDVEFANTQATWLYDGRTARF